MSSAPFEEGFSSDFDLDSGYNSTIDFGRHQPDIFFSKQHLKFLNVQLQNLSPEDILRWCAISLPNLYQETALGMTGLVQLDMLSKLDSPIKPHVEVVFIDTLHNFPETIALLDRVRNRYPGIKFHTFKPEGVETEAEFAAKYGPDLWETNDERYDYLAKVEPTQRAYHHLKVKAVLTGRRRSQGGKRKGLDIIEIDDKGIVKVNPLANWSFDQVADYIRENEVPYNELLDQGYKSIGDWHSTQPVVAGEDERSGRWRGQAKTECGIHNPNSRYAQFLLAQQQQKQVAALTESIDSHLYFDC